MIDEKVLLETLNGKLQQVEGLIANVNEYMNPNTYYFYKGIKQGIKSAIFATEEQKND